MVNTWKVILATLVIFGTGVITGGLLVNYSDRALRRPLRRLPATAGQLVPADSQRVPVQGDPGLVRENKVPPPFGVPLRKDFLDRLHRELKLSPEQRERIEKIISSGQERTRELWQKVEPEIRAELAETKDRIRAELTLAQQTRFAELLKQRARDQRHPLPGREGVSTNSPPPNP